MGKVGESITLSWQINYKKWKIKKNKKKKELKIRERMLEIGGWCG